MADHLWPLLLLEAGSEEQRIEQYRQIYLETYVRQAHTDWQGSRVIFHALTFDHAFSESGNYRLSAGVHDAFSLRRAQRMLWIREVLIASSGSIERRHQMRPDSRGRPRKRRSLIVTEEGYVVVLQERAKQPGELEFVTAFPTDRAYLEKLRRESVLLEIKKPQSYGD